MSAYRKKADMPDYTAKTKPFPWRRYAARALLGVGIEALLVGFSFAMSHAPYNPTSFWVGMAAWHGVPLYVALIFVCGFWISKNWNAE